MSAATDQRVSVIVAAAGIGARLGDSEPKAFASFSGRTLLEHCLAGLIAAQFEPHIIVAVPESHLSHARQICADFPTLRIDIVVGGQDRTDTVRRALAVVDAKTDVVLVHDAARAFTPIEVFDRVIAQVCAGSDSVIPVIDVADTIRRVDTAGNCDALIDRSTLRVVQTPQGFRCDALLAAYRAAQAESATDDAAIMELAGHRSVTVAGDRRSFKVTDPFDRLIATALLSAAPPA